MYKDTDIGLDFSRFERHIIESHHDDDNDTDTEVLNSGKQTCFQDLLTVKAALKLRAEELRRRLNTFKIWAPKFGG